MDPVFTALVFKPSLDFCPLDLWGLWFLLLELDLDHDPLLDLDLYGFDELPLLPWTRGRLDPSDPLQCLLLKKVNTSSVRLCACCSSAPHSWASS